MARRKRLYLLPEVVHRLDQAKSRDQMLDTYANLERKRDWIDQRNFQRVEDPADYFYAGLDPRRRNVVADGGMVQEDRKEVANLSRRFVHREYPQAGFNSSPFIDSTVKGDKEEKY